MYCEQKLTLLGLGLLLVGSHWWALVLTLRGHGLPLVTLQSAAVPWETWLVIPLSWLLLLRVLAPPTTASGQTSGAGLLRRSLAPEGSSRDLGGRDSPDQESDLAVSNRCLVG
jgi:hypothetical protein